MSVQMHTPPLTKTNKTIITIHVALFLLHSIVAKLFGLSLATILGLSAARVNVGMIFQFVTFPFVEASFMAVLFNSLLIWFIGADLEYKWGRKFYLQFFAVTTLSAGFIYYLASIFFKDSFFYAPFMGLTGFTYALLVAYGIIYSERQMTFMLLFPMRAKYFCMLLVGIQLYMGIFSPSGKVAIAHLSSMGIGYLFLNYRSIIARGGFRKLKEQNHKKKMKGRLKLVKEDSEDGPDPKNPRFWQ